MIKIDLDLGGVMAMLNGVEKQARFAASKALNATATDVRDAIKDDIRTTFDRPTPYIVNAIKVTRWARRDDLSAVVEAKYPGGKGVEPAKVLAAEIAGGRRRYKRSELLLQRAGILPPGYYTVPGQQCPLDAYGNIKGSFVVQLVSYFQAFGEVGFKANMTAGRKAKLAKRGRSARGYAAIMGVEYFVSYGKLRGGVGSWLHPGIWARSGIHGSTVKPIIMFVPLANYRPRLKFAQRGESVARRVFPAHFSREFAQAMRTAR